MTDKTPVTIENGKLRPFNQVFDDALMTEQKLKKEKERAPLGERGWTANPGYRLTPERKTFWPWEEEDQKKE